MPRIVLLALAFGSPLTSPVDACHNGVELELDRETAQTSQSERRLRTGRIRSALQLAGRIRRGLTAYRTSDGFVISRRASLLARLDRVLAVITVRLGGGVDRDRWRASDDAPRATRRDNLQWAADRLAALLADSPDDPVTRARLGEAWLHFPAHHAEAATMLQELSDDRVMPDVYGYATLAKLHDALGNEIASADALRRCHARANRAERGVCRI